MNNDVITKIGKQVTPLLMSSNQSKRFSYRFRKGGHKITFIIEFLFKQYQRDHFFIVLKYALINVKNYT